jgi:hypothetical protein
VRRPKNLVDGRPALSVTAFRARNRARQAAPLPNRILRSALLLSREGKDHAGASLRMTAILMRSVFSDSVSASEDVQELPALAPSVISKEAPHRTIGSHENLRAD